ncbi:MAG: hypothetical protein JNM17_05180 [Archangium sp.]|nr:hypothetical protein [Archangium sp.]
MSTRNLIGLVLAFAVAGAVYFLWPQEKLSPEDQIRRLVAKTVKAAEARDPAEVVEALDDKFRGPAGTGKDQVKGLLLQQFFGAASIVVMNPTLEVTVVSPTSGQFKGTFVFARNGASLDASKYEISGDLEKIDGEWKIISASWNR